MEMVKWNDVYDIFPIVVQDHCKHSICDHDHEKNDSHFLKVFNLKYGWGKVFFREFLAYSDGSFQVSDKWVPKELYK